MQIHDVDRHGENATGSHEMKVPCVTQCTMKSNQTSSTNAL